MMASATWKRLVRLLVVGVAVSVAGCASGMGAADMEPGDVQVEVLNDHVQAIEVFVTTGLVGSARRLGTVQALTTRTFHVPASMLSVDPYRVQVHFNPVNRNVIYRTPELTVDPNATIEVEVQEGMGVTYYRVRD